MPRDNFKEHGRQNIRSPRVEKAIAIGDVAVHYPVATLPHLNGVSKFPRGVLRQAARLKRGKTAPRFNGVTSKPKVKKEKTSERR